MTDRQALLASVLARPADDQPRLVYADWLDEHSAPERAEYIRVSIFIKRNRKVAKNGYPVGDRNPTHKRNYARYVELGGECANRWVAELPGEWDANWKHGKPCHAIFERGFVEQVRLTAADWLAHHAALAWHPEHCEGPCPETAQPITHVRLTTFPHYTWTMANLPPGWPRIAPGGYVAANALKHVWPWLTVELPPEPREGRGATVQIGGHVMMAPEWWFEPQDLELPVRPDIADELAESASAAPPDHARRRPGHSRLPDWLAEQRRRRR